MKTKETSPGRIGATAGCLVAIISILLIAAILLLAPLFPGLPYGNIVDILSYVGSLGAIVIGVLVYHWAKSR